ncbi:hypothetical protein Vi05172_g13727 [Venturia inaequalis]|nr:hypothetical protein Vi05172_g13727 [Venturia inaequalis]
MISEILGMKSEILISGSTPKPDEDRQIGIAYFN